jgi:hypothetical protein
MEKTMSLESVDSHPHPNLIGQMNFVLFLFWIFETTDMSPTRTHYPDFEPTSLYSFSS